MVRDARRTTYPDALMNYYSTHHNAPRANFQTALFRGLAPDGGLYYPGQFPRFTPAELTTLQGASLPDVAAAVLTKWFDDEIAPDSLRKIAAAAQHFPIPLRRVNGRYVLELFHGPTKAFKDVAAQNLSRLMSHFLHQDARRITLLVATSGDTGGAIAHGFAGIDNIDVYVLFPRGRVSGLQEEQLTRVASNIHPVEVDGVFDDCQALVKQAFNDPDLAALNLTSANSISIGRLIPQIIYYVYAYAVLQRDDIEFVVPSGNFGNLTGGLFARAMGLPFRSFVAATNANDTAVRYVTSGAYDPHPTIQTLSNAMDVGNPSNFVRLLELFNHDHAAFTAVIRACAVSDAETVTTLRRVYDATGYLLDPHTAVGWTAADRCADPALETVLIATADPVKFAAEIGEKAGIRVDDSAAIAALRTRAQRRTALANDYAALKALLLAGTRP